MGSFEIYRKFDGSSLTVERQTVHVSDDTGRIAMLETRTAGLAADDNGTEGVLTRYIYSNHLQSASLELDENANIISYEEYHPYGTTSSYQAMNASIKATAKRYRYTGKERDEESGLYYHGARYYIPWLARWTAINPMEAKYAGMSPYNYSFNNPVMYNDPSGKEGESTAKGGWYSNKQNNLVYVAGITTKEQFEKSEHKDNGTWWATNGSSANAQQIDNFNSDGTVLRTYNESGIEILYSNKEYNKHKNDKDPNTKGWLQTGENSYEYVSYGYLQKNGIKAKLYSEIGDGITGSHNKADGKIKKVPIFTSVNVASTKSAPKPTVTSTISVAPPKPEVPLLQSNGGSDVLGTAQDIFDNSTFIPGTALSFVETKAGKMMAIGGSHVWKSSTYSAQRSLARELAIGSKGIKIAGNTLGIVGLGFTGADIIQNGFNTSNSLDAAMGIISFVPGWGWIVGGIYFIGNAALESTTGKNLGHHIDGWIQD